jgi:hypothetical protein
MITGLPREYEPTHTPSGSHAVMCIEAYLTDIVEACAAPNGSLVSLILFGSGAIGGYATAISDVDLLIVIGDGADDGEKHRIGDTVAELEERHGLAKQRHRPTGALSAALEGFADRVSANVRSFFVCTRNDLLSGDPARILDLPPAQARFVDRVAIPSIVASGATVWGEDLLSDVSLPPIRRIDVAKAFFGLFNQTLFAAAVYPLLPGATKYAMDALKRSIHNCYFCYHARTAPLATEIAFFESRYGHNPVLKRLLALRREYQPSFRFVLGCLPALARLHLRTACNVEFPRVARSRDEPCTERGTRAE